MKFELFIAGRYLRGYGAGFSKPIVRIAVASVAIGLAAMIVSVSVVRGFQNKVGEKVTGFGADIRISSFETTQSFESIPVSKHQPFFPGLESMPGVRYIQVYATKAGIIKTEDQIEGVILKGVGDDYDWNFFNDKLLEGEHPVFTGTDASDEVLISKTLSSRLGIETGDPVRMYFIMGDEIHPRGRRFTVSGIYETGLEEFDRMYIYGDIRHVQKLNDWEPDQVGGFEVFVEDFGALGEMAEKIYERVGFELNTKTIKELHPQIFEWLSLHDMNAIVIIVLMLVVAAITMISTLLILILERTQLIGILKALGANNASLRKIFLINAVYIVGKGMFWGNVAGVGICLIQLYTGILKLNQESYYVSEVPVELGIDMLLILNLSTFLVCSLLMILPSYVIRRIAPIRIIRYG